MAERGRQSDATLLLGSPEELGEFYSRFEPRILRYFYRRTRDAEVAADLTAETFARVVAVRQRFDAERGTVPSWLFGIAHNVLTRSFDAGRVQDAARRALAMQPLVLDDARIEAITELGESWAADALNELPAEQAAAVVGRVIDELHYSELALRLNCSESVVRKRVSRGLGRLKSNAEAYR